MQIIRQLHPKLVHTCTYKYTSASASASTYIERKPLAIMTATPANIDSTSLRLHHFQQAIESVYGDFSSIKEPQSWIPPPYSGGHKGRYLWTDAFGVLNLITLHQESQRLEERISQSQVEGVVQPNGGERVSKKYLTLASRLVETVHDVLGRTRDGRSRLPGATDENPLGGGLRIGKLEERGPDGDGQYHHYLTMWMFALNRLCLATNDPYYNIQAVMLAKTIHPHFFMNRKSNSPRMVWKVKMDLSAPLVMSEGNLDPIDGYVIYRLLQATAAREQEMNRGYYDIENQGDRGHVLQEEISDYYRVMMRKGEQFVSTDPLDLGMSLWTAHWFSEKENWAAKLSGRCFEQIYNLFEIDRYLQRHIKYRLAFREFGTCLGVLCHSEQETEKERAVDLKVYADAIIHAWEPYMGLAIDQGLTENDLKPITRIMYATALIPGAFRCGYLGPEPKTKLRG